MSHSDTTEIQDLLRQLLSVCGVLNQAVAAQQTTEVTTPEASKEIIDFPSVPMRKLTIFYFEAPHELSRVLMQLICEEKSCHFDWLLKTQSETLKIPRSSADILTTEVTVELFAGERLRGARLISYRGDKDLVLKEIKFETDTHTFKFFEDKCVGLCYKLRDMRIEFDIDNSRLKDGDRLVKLGAIALEVGARDVFQKKIFGQENIWTAYP